jgi:hypothetical protein
MSTKNPDSLWRRIVYWDEDTGQVATILGYPTDKLSQAV